MRAAVEIQVPAAVLGGSPPIFARLAVEAVRQLVLSDNRLLGGRPSTPGEEHARCRSDEATCWIDVRRGWRSGFLVYVGAVPGASRLRVQVEPASKFFLSALWVNLAVAIVLTILLIAFGRSEPQGIRHGEAVAYGMLGFMVVLFTPVMIVEWVIARLANPISGKSLERIRDAVAASLETQAGTTDVP